MTIGRLAADQAGARPYLHHGGPIQDRRGAGEDALPPDPRQDVRWLTSGAAPLIVYAFRRVRRSTSTDAFHTGDAGRAGVPLPSEAVHRT